MDNPSVHILKNNILLPVESLAHIEPPFTFVTSEGMLCNVSLGDRPIYFQRKRMRIVGGKPVDKKIHRVCIGSITSEGKNNRHWLDSDGHYIGLNTEPIKD